MRKVYVLGNLGLHGSTIVDKITSYLSTAVQTEVRYSCEFTGDTKPWKLQSLDPNIILNFQHVLELDFFNSPSTIFFPEFWNPLIETARIYVNNYKKDVKLVALHHGSSHVNGDLMATSVGEDLSRHMEYSWLACLDYLLVGSRYAKDCIVKIHPEFESKIIVTYLPFDPPKFIERKEYAEIIKPSGKILFPHRLSQDKNWESVYNFIKYVLKRKDLYFTTDDFIVCTPIEPRYAIREMFSKLGVSIKAYSRKQFHNQMYSCRYVYSDALQETFGYSVLEAFFSGCIPVLSQHPLYQEFFGYDMLFEPDNHCDIIEKMKNLTYPYIIRDRLFKLFDSAEENIAKILV